MTQSLIINIYKFIVFIYVLQVLLLNNDKCGPPTDNRTLALLQARGVHTVRPPLRPMIDVALSIVPNVSLRFHGTIPSGFRGSTPIALPFENIDHNLYINYILFLYSSGGEYGQKFFQTGPRDEVEPVLVRKS